MNICKEFFPRENSELTSFVVLLLVVVGVDCEDDQRLLNNGNCRGSLSKAKVMRELSLPLLSNEGQSFPGWWGAFFASVSGARFSSSSSFSFFCAATLLLRHDSILCIISISLLFLLKTLLSLLLASQLSLDETLLPLLHSLFLCVANQCFNLQALRKAQINLPEFRNPW